MAVESCIPIIPSSDLERSLRFWVDGLGLSVERPMRRDGLLVGCMVRGRGLSFWLNQRTGPPITPEGYEGIRLYWTPGDIRAFREHLLRLGYPASEIVDRDYGQTEFFVVDDDNHSHCFGVPTRQEPLPDAERDQDAAR
jgi:catechol 2,3-dioxygenase-like lactoylglutathione lyase family enzyme